MIIVCSQCKKKLYTKRHLQILEVTPCAYCEQQVKDKNYAEGYNFAVKAVKRPLVTK